MTARSYAMVTALLFGAIAVVHGLRLIYDWEVTVRGEAVESWVSWVGMIVAVVLAAQGFRLARR